MYKSGNLSYFSLKFIPLIIGIISIITAFLIIVDPTFVVTVNGVERNAILSDCVLPLIVGSLCVLFYFSIGQRIVKMGVNNNNFEFKFKGQKYIKKWDEVEVIIKYWLVAPPLYSIKFESDKRTYLFSTGYFFISTPFYVFDLSSMGDFIKRKRKDIPILKELRNKGVSSSNT